LKVNNRVNTQAPSDLKLSIATMCNTITHAQAADSDPAVTQPAFLTRLNIKFFLHASIFSPLQGNAHYLAIVPF
jgi:hypothetical protein